MKTIIRFSTLNQDIPLFTEGGLDLAAKGWSSVDFDTATPLQRDSLELYLGRLLQVHELDADAFYGACAPLELFEGKLRYPVGTDLTTVAPIGRRHQAAASSASQLTSTNGERLDGPTLEEFVRAGYPAENYPPLGYAEKPSAGLTKLRKTVAPPVRESIAPSIIQPNGPAANAGGEPGDAPNADVTKPSPAVTTPPAPTTDSPPIAPLPLKGSKKS